MIKFSIRKIISGKYMSFDCSFFIYFQARKIQTPKMSNQIFLPAIAVDFYLNKLQKNNFNIFDKSLHQGNATLPFKLYYNRLVNKY